MSISDFWSQGYWAGLNGDECLPPPESASNTQAREYQDGYYYGDLAKHSASVMGLSKDFK